jgi:hypothetical protein
MKVFEPLSTYSSQPLLRLLWGAVPEEVRQTDVVVEGEPEGCAVQPDPVEFLGDDQVETEVVTATTTQLGGDGHPEVAVGAGLLEHGPVDDAGSVPGAPEGDHVALDEPAEAGAEGVVFVVEQGTAHGSPRIGRRHPGHGWGSGPAPVDPNVRSLDPRWRPTMLCRGRDCRPG